MESAKPSGTCDEIRKHSYLMMKTATAEALMKSPKGRKHPLLRKIRLRKSEKKPKRSDWWTLKARKARKDKISEEVRKQVQQFYLEPAVSREVPDKSAAVKIKINGETKVLPRHHMTCFMSEAYDAFKAAHPNSKVGFTVFKKLRPKQVKWISETNRKKCLCQQCCNPSLKTEALKKFCSKSENADVKMHGRSIKLSPRETARATLCPYDKYPSKACLSRECTDCGTKTLNDHHGVVIAACKPDDLITWYSWAPMTLMKNGSPRRIIFCQAQTTSIQDFMEAYRKDLETLPEHLFRASWQHGAMTTCINQLQQDETALVMDYAESYQCVFREEVQSAFFDPNSVTIHPMMAYYRMPNGQMMKHAIIGVSDVDSKDATGVIGFENTALGILKDHIPDLKAVHEFTDGCAAQYKGRNSFCDISNRTNIKLDRNYFETSHGKSVCDGLGSTVKNSAYWAVVSGKAVISTAKDFFTFCRENLTKPPKEVNQGTSSYISHREFIFTEKDLAFKRPDVKPIKGTRALHAVTNTQEPHKIMKRNLSCFCPPCMSDEGEMECVSRQYVEPWVAHKVELKKHPSLLNHQLVSLLK